MPSRPRATTIFFQHFFSTDLIRKEDEAAAKRDESSGFRELRRGCTGISTESMNVPAPVTTDAHKSINSAKGQN